MNTGITAHTAPGFPVLVAGVYRVFGDQSQGAYALEMIEAVVMVAGIALLPLVMHALGASVPAGLLAGFIAILGIRRVPTWEANYAALLLMVAILLAFRYWLAISGKIAPSRHLTSPWSIALVLGSLWGAILLISPSTGSVWAVWLMLGAWISRRSGFRYAWLPCLIIPLILIAPWEWRNYRIFHAFVPLRDSFGLELRLSNNPCAKVTLWQNRHGIPCYDHPNESVAEAQKIMSQGEIAYNAQKTRDAIRWIAGNPAKALGLWTRRLQLFWFPKITPQIAIWTINLITPLSLLGLVFLFRMNRASTILLSTLLLIYPLIYYIIQASDRYRIPILWVSYGLAAVAVTSVANKALARIGLGEL
jgi:hypothetical protein